MEPANRSVPGAAGLAAIVLCLSLTGSAAAEPPERVALVIGNSDYPSYPLRNPENDATAIGERLADLGFDVILRLNADRQAMAQSIQEFAGRLGEGSVGLFYYAGHGIQARGRNFLIPVDAELTAERALKFEAIDVTSVLEDMEFAGNRLNIVILDACRNNPFERRFRGVSRGLAAIDAARGTLIAYATAPGAVAADGTGENGLYTEELLHALARPGLKAEEVFKRVRIAVSDRSQGRQVPWESSSLTGDFVFNPVNPSAKVSASGAPSGRSEVLFWESVKDSEDARAFEAYLDRYPEGTFSDLARLRIESLETARSEPSTTSHTHRPQRIAALLEKARLDMENQRLTSPPGENAVEKLRAVLALDPDNADATRGLEEVVGRYVLWANAAMDRDDWDRARDYLARAETVSPHASDVALARARLSEGVQLERSAARSKQEAERRAALEEEAARQRQRRIEREREIAERERRLAEQERRMTEQVFRGEFGSEARVLAASSKGLTVKLQGRVQAIRDFAIEFCRQHGKRSSLVSANPITHERSYVCY